MGTGLWVSWHEKLAVLSKNRGHFYGMEWPWVGAFTDFGGIRYRNPVQISGGLAKNRTKSGFWGVGVIKWVKFWVFV